jgi:hypothetical protein
MKPARRVVTRAPSQNVGVVSCPWLQAEDIEHESITERWFLVLAVLLPRLQRIQHQPFQLELPPADAGADDAKAATYVPDFLLEFKSGERVVVEVKPEKFVPKHRARLLAAAEVLKSRDHSFFVITDRHLESTASMAEGIEMRRRAKGPRPVEETQRALAALAAALGYVTVGELCAVADVSIGAVAWLVGRAMVGTKTPSVTHEQTLVIHLDKEEDCNAALSVGRWFASKAW